LTINHQPLTISQFFQWKMVNGNWEMDNAQSFGAKLAEAESAFRRLGREINQ